MSLEHVNNSDIQPHDHADAHNLRQQSRNRLLITFLLTSGFMLIEILGGIWTGSLALIADAGHMATDAASIGLALFAVWLASKKPPSSKTFGYYRAEVLAALANGVALIGMSVLVVLETFNRAGSQSEIKAGPMLVIAILGLLVNLLAATLLYSTSEKSINVRGAFLHVLGDALGSVGAIFAAVLILTMNLYVADLLVSLGIAILIVMSAVSIVNDSLQVLFESVPKGINYEEVKRVMMSIEGVSSVHDLHIWTVTPGFNSLSVHVVIEPQKDFRIILRNLQNSLTAHFSLHHSTIQFCECDHDMNEDDLCSAVIS